MRSGYTVTDPAASPAGIAAGRLSLMGFRGRIDHAARAPVAGSAM